jgi:hypothetical protein
VIPVDTPHSQFLEVASMESSGPLPQEPIAIVKPSITKVAEPFVSNVRRLLAICWTTVSLVRVTVLPADEPSEIL